MAAAAIIPVLMAAGTAVQIGSQFAAGRAAKKQGQANKETAEAAAVDAIQIGEQEAGKIRLAGDALAGRAITAYGHAGVDVATGTPAQALTQMAGQVELDAQIAKNNAYRRAWGYRKQGAQFSAAGNAEAQTYYLNAIGNVLSGAGRYVGGGR